MAEGGQPPPRPSTGESTMSQRSKNRVLWITQTLLALLFIFAGTMKFIIPAEKMQGPIVFSITFIHFIGICEILGGLGLVLPGLFRVATALTSIAAAGLVIIMAGATTATIIGMGFAPAIFPLVIGFGGAASAIRGRGAPPRRLR